MPSQWWHQKRLEKTLGVINDILMEHSGKGGFVFDRYAHIGICNNVECISCAEMNECGVDMTQSGPGLWPMSAPNLTVCRVCGGEIQPGSLLIPYPNYSPHQYGKGIDIKPFWPFRKMC
jgi:hypothetical protein